MVDRVLQLPFPQARSHRGDKGFVGRYPRAVIGGVPTFLQRSAIRIKAQSETK